MNVRTGTATRIAHQGDRLAPFNTISFFGEYLLDMTESGHHSESVLDGHHIAHQAFVVRKGYDAVCRRSDRRTCVGRNINAAMKFPAAGKG